MDMAVWLLPAVPQMDSKVALLRCCLLMWFLFSLWLKLQTGKVQTTSMNRSIHSSNPISSWVDKIDLRSITTVVTDCRKLNIHQDRITIGSFADFVFWKLNTSIDSIIHDSTCKPSQRIKGGYLQSLILSCNCRNTALRTWLPSISRQQALHALYEIPSFISVILCSWCCLLLSGAEAFSLCLHHLNFLNRNWANILMMNINCISAKVPIQKQGEYSSCHSCIWCNIVESVIIGCKFHVKNQWRNTFLRNQFSLVET